MMEFVFSPIWAALQIGFALAFLSSFLEIKRRMEEVTWLAVIAWLMTAIYSLLRVEGIYGYLLYLLSAVMLLLTVYGEYGPKGLCLLAFTFLIPLVVDMAVLYLVSDVRGLPLYLARTGAKLLPLLLVLAMRKLKLFSPQRTDAQQEQDMLLLRQNMEMQRDSMTALEANYRMQRRSAHEFEHHIQVLRDLLDRNETDAARDYLHRLQKNRSIHTMSVNSNHPVIDVILNQKYQTAWENEIKMQITVNDLSALTIPTDSLVVVLTNLLDNAIEACRHLDGYREILCSVLYDDGLYISIRNTSAPVEIIDGKIPTSKQDSISHGFGLMSVRYCLDKMEAEYTFDYEEGWFHFAAEIG